MKSKLLVILILAFTLMSSGIGIHAQGETAFECPETEGTVDIIVAAGAVGQEMELAEAAFAVFHERCPNINIGSLQAPELATDRLGLYIQFLGVQSDAVDIYQIDIPWISIMEEHMVDLYEYAPFDSEIIQQHFPTIIENNTVNGKLVGIPWFTDAGLLYYRTDLLEKYELELPSTWDELENAARAIQEGERAEGNNEFWGYVWQGNIGEPTTINALEWQASNGGGVIIAPNGEIQVNNPETIEAIERAAAWVGDISPDTVIAHRPEDSRSIFQAGNAAFMRNWPYAYDLGNQDNSPIQGLFDVSPIPGGANDLPGRGVLGGWQLAVSKYSSDPDVAAAVALFLASEEIQKNRAVQAAIPPTIESLYEDEDVLAAVDFFDTFGSALDTVVPRPSTVAGNRYNDVSSLYSAAVHSVLSGENDATTAMEDLEFDLEDLILDNPDSFIIAQTETEEPEAADETEEPEATEVVAATAAPEATPQVTETTTDDAEESSGTDPIVLVGIGAAILVVLGGAFFFLRGGQGAKAK